ncbi:MAG: winged helix-turn-helix domain-containing protein [Patescibacteria group bacterium]
MRLLLICEHYFFEKSLIDNLKKIYVIDLEKDLENGCFQAYLYQYDSIIICSPKNEHRLAIQINKLREDKISSPIICLCSSHNQKLRQSLYLSGANDILLLPVSEQELTIKLRHQIQFLQHLSAQPSTSGNHKIRLDQQARLLFYRDQSLALRRKELLLIECFLRNPKQILTKQQIKERVWLDDLSVSDNNFCVSLCSLRKKVFHHFKVDPITTCRGYGYKLSDEIS